MNFDHLPINWFDFAVIIVVLLGISKGRKNGMSVELLGMLQWITIVVAGAFLYRPLGEQLSHISPVGSAFAYTSMYVAVAIVVKIIFSVMKKAIGGRLMEANAFGRAEFYLGMLAGAVRFLCVTLAALALLNAPYYSPAELARNKAVQVDLYGSNFFPNVGTVQQQVFKESLLGSAVKNNASLMLIVTTTAEQQRGTPQKKAAAHS
jgi:uncharacterized membrane protein required for colicin V production